MDTMGLVGQMLDSGVSAQDPRALVVCTMLGAIEADGQVNEAEIATLRRNLADNELFSGLCDRQRADLVDLATTIVNQAGPQRLPSIVAKGLPSRGHRMAAYVMACEVCCADSALVESEATYLRHLQEAFELDEFIAKDLFAAVRASSGLKSAEEKAQAMKMLMPFFVDCMTLIAQASHLEGGCELEGVRAVLRQIPDLGVLGPDELEQAINDSFARTQDKDFATTLAQIANTITYSADRYWAAVYMMIVTLAAGEADWRSVSNLQTTHVVFDLPEDTMDLAQENARSFPFTKLGGSAPIGVRARLVYVE